MYIIVRILKDETMSTMTKGSSQKKNFQTLDIVQTMGGRSEQGQTFFLYECLDISLMGRGVRALRPK